jgi:hypothetical protein
MSLLKKAQTNVKPEDIKGGKETDRLGGGGVLETAVYPFVLDSIYTTESKKSAVGIVVNLLVGDNQQKYSETFWITTGSDKGCNPYYEKDGQKNWLPSYVMLDSFTNMINGKGITDQDTDTRVLNIYDYETQKEIPTKVETLVDLLGIKGFVAITKVRSNKQVKGDNGYVDSPEERFTNQVSKFFNSEKQTATEKAAGVAGTFADKWAEKYNGKVTDKYKEVKGVAAGAPSRPNTPPVPTSSGSAPADEDDLFA